MLTFGLPQHLLGKIGRAAITMLHLNMESDCPNIAQMGPKRIFRSGAQGQKKKQTRKLELEKNKTGKRYILFIDSE